MYCELGQWDIYYPYVDFTPPAIAHHNNNSWNINIPTVIISSIYKKKDYK